jgi:iron(III) transport system substrate-binding protein
MIKFLVMILLAGASLFNAQAAEVETVSADLLAKAKAEGQLTWYTPLPVAEAQNWAAQFERKYGVKVNVFRGGTASLTQRLQTEIPAGHWAFDVILHRTTNIDIFRRKGWLQKLNYAERSRFPEGFADADDYWVTSYILPWVIGYNSNLVKGGEVPKSYDDLLHPKWKSKTVIDEQDVDLYATMLKIMGPEKGREWFKRLAANGLQSRRGHTLEVQLMSAGEFALDFGAYAPMVESYRDKGAPVNWVAPEPVPVNVYAMALSAKPPRPNAARLFINWSLSAEGLKSLNEVADRLPVRTGVSIKNKRLEQLIKTKLMPLDISIAEKYAEYNKEFLTILGLQK